MLDENSTRLQSRTAIVVGGDVIGQGIASALRASGASVVLIDGADADSNWLQVVAEFAATLAGLKMLDIVVTNLLPAAAVARLERLSTKELSQHLTIVETTLLIMQAALPLLRQSGAGRIVTVGHRYGENVNAEIGAYGAGVGALWALTRSAAVEWGQFGITSNLLVPFAQTPELQAAKAQRPQLIEVLLQQLPLRRAGDPQADIGGVCVFLASLEAAFINGEVLYADGGQHIAGPVLNPSKFAVRQ